MAVNFLTLRSAVANDIAVQHLTYSTMVGHPTASHQTVQAIITSSIMTMGHVGIGATAALSGTALHVVGSTMISGNVSIVGGATGDPLRVNNNKTTGDDTPSFILRNNQTIPSQLVFIQKTTGAAAYNAITQAGDTVILSQDQRAGVAGANGIVICGQDQTAALRIGTTSSAFNGELTISGTTMVGNRFLGSTDSSPNGNFWLGLRGSGIEGDRLAISLVGNATTGAVSRITLNKPTDVAADFVKVGGNSAQNRLSIRGEDALNSPYLEFFVGNTRRSYIGYATTTSMNVFTENGANLQLGTEGTTRLTINTTGDITASNPITAPSFVVNGGGSWVPGVIYSDANHGMLFRAKVPGSANIFLWNNSAGAEVLKMFSNGSMNHLMGDNSYMKYGPNSSWNSNLIVGATPDRAGAGTAQVICTNGNLHLDAGNSNDIYYGLYATQRGTPNAHRFSGHVHISADMTGSEVYTNNWFRVNGGGGLYWQTYGRGIQAADSAGASYGNITTYGTGINTYNGYDINGRYTFMANGDTVGIHDRNHSWVWYNVNGSMIIPKTLTVSGGITGTITNATNATNATYAVYTHANGITSIEARLAALEAKVYSIMPLDGYIRAGPDFYISIRGMGGQALRYVNISAAAVAAGSFYAYGYRDI